MEIRCGNNILFGVLEDGVLEVKCRSRRCGHETGTVVLHRFSLKTGELQGTLKFKDPADKKGVSDNGNANNVSSLRTA